VYDRQVEVGREEYLFELIHATGDPVFYRDQLVAALGEVQDEADDRSQIAAVLGLFARAGDVQARQGLYDGYARRAAVDASRLPDTIVQLDGAAGLLFVAEHRPLDEDEGPDPWWLATLAADKDGQAAVELALECGAAASLHIAAFLATAHAQNWPPSPNRGDIPEWAREEADMDYGRIRRRLLTGDTHAVPLLMRWGLQASDTELVRAAGDLLETGDPRVRRAYLRLFCRRPFPLDPQPLLELIEQDEAFNATEFTDVADTAFAALGALRLVTDPRVRARGLALIAQGVGLGAGLLVANYQPGDYARLEAALETWSDRDQLHALGHGLLDMADARPAPEAVPALLALYERGPCSRCRRRALEFVGTIDTVPARLVAECRYDANPEIRRMFERSADPGSRPV
jgi:hypothetical protein